MFFLPSERESFGLSALEAMACEVPVICSNAGGLPEVVLDGVTGYLSNVGDVEKMAQDAIQLLSDPEKLLQFRKNALEHAKQFDLNIILQQYEDIYSEVIQSSKQKMK